MIKYFLSTIPLLVFMLGCSSSPKGHLKAIRQNGANSPSPKQMTIKTSVAGKSDSGFLSVIRGGTKWELVGVLDEGTVYKPLDTTLVVHDSKLFEAFLVVHENRWVGFYFPVDKVFSPIKHVMPLEIEHH